MGAISIALLPGEPIRPRMAGIGIRFLELARALSAAGHPVLLASPGPETSAEGIDLGSIELRRIDHSNLSRQLPGCDMILAQGGSAERAATELADRPLVFDLYDPYPIENLTYAAELGAGVFARDLNGLKRQLLAGDFFLCANENQRNFYLGLLTAWGRVAPELWQADPSLRRLIDLAPFFMPDAIPPHRTLLPARQPDERRLLFGTLYDWYDPWPLLEALAQIDLPQLRLIFVRTPNATTTPQTTLTAVERWAGARGWLGERIQILDWVAGDRRFDLLRDVDAMIAFHRPSFEAVLSLRTRFVDALAVGLPVIVNPGGAISDWLVAHPGHGQVLAVEDREGLIAAIRGIADGATIAREPSAAIAEFSRAKAMAPLLRFAALPSRDPFKATATRHADPARGGPGAIVARAARKLRRMIP